MNERRQSGRRIVEFQANQFLLADLATDLAMIDSWLDYLAGLIDGDAEEFELEASMAKMRASDLAMRTTTEAVQMHGGYGYCSAYRVERLMRDAKITQIWEGTNQIHRQLIGRSFVKNEQTDYDRGRFAVPVARWERNRSGGSTLPVCTISYDISEETLDRAAKQSETFLDKSVDRAELKKEARDKIIASMSRTTDVGALGACDLVIEAIFEKLSVKRDLLQLLDAACSQDTIFASNTSTLSITEIASGSCHPERMVRMHFCLPAHKPHAFD